MQKYIEILCTVVEKDDAASSGSGTLLLELVLPLLALDSFRERVQYLRACRMFLELQQEIQYAKDQTTSQLHLERSKLRGMVEDSENSLNDVERYAPSPDIHCSLPGLAYPQIKEDANRIYAEARRLESEVRDYMQLEVGKLSLEESRKSIELSNHQILEGNRVHFVCEMRKSDIC